MGKIDRFIRVVIAVVIALLYSSNIVTGALAIGLLALAVVFVLTSFAGFCPLYYPFGFSTKKKSPTV